MALPFHSTFTTREKLVEHLQPLIHAIEEEDWNSLRLAIRQLEKPETTDTKTLLEMVCMEIESEPGKATKGKVLERFGELYPDTELPSSRTLSDWWKEIGFDWLEQDRMGS